MFILLTDSDEEYFPPEEKKNNKRNRKKIIRGTPSNTRMIGETFSNTSFISAVMSVQGCITTQILRMLSIINTHMHSSGA